MKPKLTLTFEPSFGKRFVMCIDLDEHDAREMEEVKPPLPSELGGTFEDVAITMRIREYRKDRFIAECHRLGMALAERMEDAEGWHDVSRIEPAKKALRG